MIKQEEYEFVRKQIKNVFHSIQKLEFEQGCEEDDCEWV